MRFLWIVLWLVAACVSRSVWNERFSESKTLALPPINIVLSDPESFSFALVGDLHVGGSNSDQLRKTLEMAQAEGDQFIVLLGDMTDKGEMESYQAIQKALSDFGWSDRALPLLGNHDIFSDGWKNYRDVFGKAHYSVDIGNSRFIALDSADGVLGKEQFDWLEQKLAEPKATNTFLLTHYMPVVPGQQTYLKLSNQMEAEAFMALASQKGVRAVLGGHYHSFCFKNIAGVDYVVAGGGGRRMDPVREYFFVQAKVSGSSVQFQLKVLD